MKLIRNMIATILITSACWGLMSPEYIFTSGSIYVVERQTGERVPFEVKAHFWNMLNATSDSIVIKSKLLEQLTDVD